MKKYIIRYWFRMSKNHIKRAITGEGNKYELRNSNGCWETVSFWRFMVVTTKQVWRLK